MERGSSPLRFVSASDVESPAGALSGFALRDTSDHLIGKIEGLLVDPAQRQLRYYVVDSPGVFRSRRFLLPSEYPARVDRSSRTLRLDFDGSDLSRYEQFDPPRVPAYSDDDLIASMFGRRTA